MKSTFRLPDGEQQALLDRVQVRLAERDELQRFNQLRDEHHYLKSVKPVRPSKTWFCWTAKNPGTAAALRS